MIYACGECAPQALYWSIMEKKLTIYYTSDVHGYLYPTDYVEAGEKNLGLMRMLPAFVRDGNTLIIDGGDSLQGSPMTNYFYRLTPEERRGILTDTRFGTHPIAAVMNLAGYRYVTLGNHDFNHGVDALMDYLTALDAECLCCNIRDRAGKLPLKPWAIHTLENGLRVGIVGACTDFVRRWEDPDTVKELIIEEPVEACRRALDEIRGKCDLTLLVYHGGFECDLTDGHSLTESRENQACRICREMDYDIVLTGHQHFSVPLVKFAGSFVCQPAYRGIDFCRLEALKTDSGLTVRGENPGADLPASAEAMELLRPLETATQRWLDTPVGHLDGELAVGSHIEMGLYGSDLANFINTVLLELTGAQVSATALANEAKGLPRDITIRNVVAAYIYANTSVVLDMSVSDLRRYMERSAEYFDPQDDGSVTVSESFLLPKVQHFNYDFFAGAEYEIDLSKPPKHRITSLRMNGRELREDEHVTVCINSYRHNGTGGYDMLPGQPVVKEVLVDIADAIIDYIIRHPDITVDRRKWYRVTGIKKA